MTTELQIIIVLAIIVVVLFLLWRRAQRRISELSFAKQSLSSKYGKMTEQFFPFLADYSYDPRRFRFLGTPIDGVQFDDKGVIFVEFKTAGSALSEGQKQIRRQIEKGQVFFEEIRID